MQNFVLSSIPEILFGQGCLADLAGKAGNLAAGRAPVLLVADPALKHLGISARASKLLEGAGFETILYDGFKGEPKESDIGAATELARSVNAGLVVGLGGGSALDTAKLAACCAVSGEKASTYALCATPLPAGRLPVIAIPTTAGTGSEVTRVSVFTNDNNEKVWAWGEQLKPNLAILDPELTIDVPPQVTAATGLDALVHAIEACTNKNRNDGIDHYCLKAISLISANLEKAVRDPRNLDARGAMLLGSCYGGIGIDNCGTALAHNISHAVADLAPIPHGRATGLAMLATIAWVAEGNPEAFGRVAQAMGIDDVAEGYERLLRSTGIKVSLADEGHEFGGAERLALHMASPANNPMRLSTVRQASESDLIMLAERFLALH